MRVSIDAHLRARSRDNRESAAGCWRQLLFATSSKTPALRSKVKRGAFYLSYHSLSSFLGKGVNLSKSEEIIY